MKILNYAHYEHNSAFLFQNKDEKNNVKKDFKLFFENFKNLLKIFLN